MVVVRETVYMTVADVAVQQNKVLPPLNDDRRMLESGLDSLSMALIIARLDDKLNVRPFDDDDTSIPVTFGDLVRIYENAVARS